MEKIPILKKTVDIPKLKSIKIGSHEFLINKQLGYFPYFTIMLYGRIKAMMANNIVGTGEGGIGKTYMLSDICRGLSKGFTVDDIVFTYKEFLRCVLTSKRGIPIEFDEPSYAVSNKDWYTDVCKALVKTIESFRFKGKPLFLPVINKFLLEKSIRNFLIQFHIHVTGRGKGKAYKLYPAQDRDKMYRYEICTLKYKLFDNNLCAISSCLKGCRKLNPADFSKRCMIFRAQYERMKIDTQETRYKKALEEAEQKQTEKLSLDEIEAKAMLHFEKFYNPDKDTIRVDRLFTVLKREEAIHIGHNKLYRLADLIKYDHPKLFQTPPIPQEKE